MAETPQDSPKYDLTKLKKHGEDVYISAQVDIRRPKELEVGNHVAIDSFLYMTVPALLGDYIHIGPSVSIIGGARGKFTMKGFNTLTTGCRVVCVSDQYRGEGLAGYGIPKEYQDPTSGDPVTIERFASVGVNSVIMPGVTVGEGCVIGAGSVVTKSTEPWSVYIGAPAKKVKDRPRDKMLAYASKLGYIEYARKLASTD